MLKYVRFVATDDEEDGYHCTGVLTEAQHWIEQDEFNAYEANRVKEIFTWLNEYLPTPPFREKIGSGEWEDDCVCWFKEDASRMISCMWEIVYLLNEIGKPARMIVTDQIGKIVYEDVYQVVAKTPKYSKVKL